MDETLALTNRRNIGNSMTFRIFLASLLFVPACGLAQQGSGPGSATPPVSPSSAFDGVWSVAITCPDVKEGGTLVKGYVFTFDAQVKNGVLSGQHGGVGAPNSLSLSGAISSDGEAQLDARGLTGNPEYSIGRVTSSTPYGYRVKARFETSRGSGERLDLRPCSFTFVRKQTH